MGSYECDTCNRNFKSWSACKQHMTAVDHWKWEYECETCTSRSSDAFYRNQHQEEENHFAYDYPCQTCNLAFRSEKDCEEHQDAQDHYRDRHCTSCDRYFQSAQNLSQHMKSRIHQGANICCPFCRVGFTTASGLSHHLESSACPNARNLNRDVIYRTMRQRDPRGVITERLLEYDSGDREEVHWSPVSAWNGNYYECYICHREFNTPTALSQHISSPAHQAPLYHCPNKTGKCGGRQFPTLAALFSHLESESCGYVKFNVVQRNVNGFLTGTGQNLIAF